MRKYKTYPPADFCKKCSGQCCDRSPGPYHPSDFQKPITVDYLLELLESKKVVIDWKGTNGRSTYFLRPPHSSDNGHFVREVSRGTCIFLTGNGCTLPYEERPLGCRSLKPDESFVCPHTDYGQYKAFRSWARHRRVIEEVIDIIDKRKKGDFSR